MKKYVGFVDPSGGSQDAFTLGIAHLDIARNIIVLDMVREQLPPFSPEGVTAEYVAELKRYGIKEVTGDHYAGEWPREQFRKLGIHYKVSDMTKSEIYLAALPLMTSGRVELLDHKRLLAQLRGLERRVARSGKDSVDHGPRGKDDISNAACGAIVNVKLNAGQFSPISYAWTKEFRTITTTDPNQPMAVSREAQAAVHPHERGLTMGKVIETIAHDVDSVEHRTECRKCRVTWRTRP